jgi:Sec-independent protein translocase protein TatA
LLWGKETIRFGIGMPELIVILVILILGVGRLREIGVGIGKVSGTSRHQSKIPLR